MKFKLVFILLCVGQICFSQTSTTSASIDTSNYYNFVQPGAGISVNWLRQTDAVPLIIDELLKKNIPYYTISVGNLIKINDSTRFVVTVSFEKGDKEYGFLYEATHGLPFTKKDRDFLTNGKSKFYVEAEKDISGNVNFMRIDPIPSSIFLLKETCYWFQFDKSGTKYPVSKDIAEKIFRQDIDNYLNKL